MSSAKPDLSKHAKIAERVIGNIVQAGGPAVSPDGSNVAFVVSSGRHGQEQDLLAGVVGCCRRLDTPEGGDGRRSRQRTGVEPRRTIAGVRVEAGREEGRDHPARPAGRHARRDPNDRNDEGRHRRGVLEPGWSSGSRSPAARPTSATTPRTRVGRRRGRSSGSSASSTTRAGSSIAPAISTSSPPTAPATPRNLTPGEFQHHNIAWKPDSSGLVLSAQRHDTWDLDFADGRLLGLARRRDRDAHRSDRGVLRPDCLAGRVDRGVSRSRRFADLPTEHACRCGARDRRGAPVAVAGAGPHLRDDDRRRFGAVARRFDPARPLPKTAAKRICTAWHSMHRRRLESRRARLP